MSLSYRLRSLAAGGAVAALLLAPNAFADYSLDTVQDTEHPLAASNDAEAVARSGDLSTSPAAPDGFREILFDDEADFDWVANKDLEVPFSLALNEATGIYTFTVGGVAVQHDTGGGAGMAYHEIGLQVSGGAVETDKAVTLSGLSIDGSSIPGSWNSAASPTFLWALNIAASNPADVVTNASGTIKFDWSDQVLPDDLQFQIFLKTLQQIPPEPEFDPRPVPALGTGLLLALSALLGGIGAFRVRRRRLG